MLYSTFSLSFRVLWYILATCLCYCVTMRRDRPKMLTYRWEGHRDNILESLHSMLDKESPVSGQVTNVTLVTDGGKLRAHQFILSAVSPYFR